MLVSREQLGGAGIGENYISRTGVPGIQRVTQGDTISTLNTGELVDIHLLTAVEKIPFHAWGGAINMRRQESIALIVKTNYSTIVAMCQQLLSEGDSYWNDSRERDFSGIMEAIDTRLSELGYEVIESEIRHYMNSLAKGRIRIPTKIQKITTP